MMHVLSVIAESTCNIDRRLISNFIQIFTRLAYSLWKGIVVETINILSTFSWNFVDLFLILISIALANQFRQLNSRLYSIRGKV